MSGTDPEILEQGTGGGGGGEGEPTILEKVAMKGNVCSKRRWLKIIFSVRYSDYCRAVASVR